MMICGDMARMMLVLVAALLPVAGGAGALQPRDGDALGRLVTAKLPGETVGYGYNVRDALTSISSPRFSQQLRYAAGAAAPCYNGNIAEAVTQGNKYAYTYDNANRLTAAKYTPSAGDADYSATYAYDRNSNITALTRKGLTGRLWTFGTVDDLVMTYDGNRLSKVTETADEVLLETSHDMQPMAITRPTVSQFRYDANGNTIMDRPRSISSITYNPLNLPQSVTIDDTPSGMISSLRDKKYINYTYDASGVKHRVIHSSTKLDVSPTGRLTTADTTDYVGNLVYLNGRLDKVLTPYGYLQGGKFHTWLHDYQGNVAAVVVGDSVAQCNSYYPYGLPHATLSIRTNVTTNTPNTYKYSGKEFDTFGGTDLYDFHARFHAPSTGRFMTVDPLAEKYPGISPYMYCAGNPIMNIDPTGMEIAATVDNVTYKYRDLGDGDCKFVDSEGNNYSGGNDFMDALTNALHTIQSGNVGNYLVKSLMSSDRILNIIPSSSSNSFDVDGVSMSVSWNPKSTEGGPSELLDGTCSIERPNFAGLAHEMAHAQDYIFGPYDKNGWFQYSNGNYEDRNEMYACYIENVIRAEHNIGPRTHYTYIKNENKFYPYEKSRLYYDGAINNYRLFPTHAKLTR